MPGCQRLSSPVGPGCDANTRKPPGGHLFLNKLWV